MIVGQKETRGTSLEGRPTHAFSDCAPAASQRPLVYLTSSRPAQLAKRQLGSGQHQPEERFKAGRRDQLMLDQPACQTEMVREHYMLPNGGGLVSTSKSVLTLTLALALTLELASVGNCFEVASRGSEARRQRRIEGGSRQPVDAFLPLPNQRQQVIIMLIMYTVCLTTGILLVGISLVVSARIRERLRILTLGPSSAQRGHRDQSTLATAKATAKATATA
ncbi:unnamed protein product, partial [Protopolystoma xenopodis]